MLKLLVSVVIMAALAASAHGQEKLKFAVFTPASEMVHQVIVKPWADRINAEARGAVDIQVYPNGALGRNPGLQTKLLQDGIADIVWTIPSYTPGVFPDDYVFELPNVIQNSTEGSLAAWRLYRKGLLRGYGDYYVITVFTSPPFTFHTNFKLTKPEDLKGKKFELLVRFQLKPSKRSAPFLKACPPLNWSRQSPAASSTVRSHIPSLSKISASLASRTITISARLARLLARSS